MKSGIARTLIITMLIMGLVSCAYGELPEDSPEYDEYIRLENDGKLDEALAVLEKIINENPGTQKEATARLYKAMALVSSGNVDIVVQELENLVRDFPGSRPAAFARLKLLDNQYGMESDFEQWLPEVDSLFTEFGLPTVSSLRDGTAQKGTKPTGLTVEEHLDLVETLIPMAIRRLDRSDRINATTFLLLSYPEQMDPASGADVISNAVFYEVAPPDEFVIPKGGPDSEPPILELERPGFETQSPVTIAVRAHDGPVSSSRMDLSSAEFTVDGSSVNPIRGTSTIENARWECVLTLTVDLPPGQHSGVFRLKDLAGNQAELPFSFIVTDNPPDPTSITLPTTKDSTLRAKKPHRNEGANPRLFLSHRLESRGKSQNPIVGFDLANEDLTGLTKATLVLNVQDCEVPRRWGNDGRYIIACPVSEPWVEGNGNKYRVQGAQAKPKDRGRVSLGFLPWTTRFKTTGPTALCSGTALEV